MVRGQLTGTRQVGTGALATSSSHSSQSGDPGSVGLCDLHKESQPQGANARRPASATGDHVHGHNSVMERSVSPTIHRIASHRAWHPCEPAAGKLYFGTCTL